MHLQAKNGNKKREEKKNRVNSVTTNRERRLAGMKTINYFRYIPTTRNRDIFYVDELSFIIHLKEKSMSLVFLYRTVDHYYASHGECP